MAEKLLQVRIQTMLTGLDQIKTLSQTLLGLRANLEEASKAAASFDPSKLAQGLGAINTSGGQASSILNKLAQAQKGVTEASKTTHTATTSLSSILGEAAGKAGEAALGVTGLGGTFGALAGTMVPAVGGFSMLKDSAGSLLTTFLALAGIKLTFDYLKDAADTAARTETLGVTLGIVGKNAGYSEETLNGYEKSLKKLGITTQSARDSMTQMIQAGIPLGPMAAGSSSNVERLARASQDLAVVTGQNSSDTFRRLITNIQQLDTMGLRFMGLTVNIQEAEQRFAASIGKTADALTQQQKVQAVNNAALEESAKLSGAYEASMDTVGKKVQSLTRYKEELANAIGEKLIPMYAAAVDAATKFLSESEKIVRATDKFGNASKDMGDGAKAAFSGMSEFSLSVEKLFAQAYEASGPLVAELGVLAGGFFRLASYVVDLVTASHLVPAVFRTIEFVIAGVIDGFKVLAAAGMGSLGLLIQGAGLLLEGLSKVYGIFNQESGDSMKKLAGEMKQAGEDMVGASKEMFSEFAKGDSEVRRVIDSIVDADKALALMGGKQTSFKGIESSIMALKRALAEGKVSSVEAGVAIADTTRQIDKLGAESGLSEKQITKLKGALASIKSDEAKKAGEALKNIGTTTAEMATGVGEKFGQMAGSLAEFVSNSTTDADSMRGAFNKVIDGAKTVAEFGAMSKAVDAYKLRIKTIGDESGIAKLHGDTEKYNLLVAEGATLQKGLAAVLGNTTLAYGAVLESSVKAAKTQDDLDYVVKGAAESFKDEMITATQFAETMSRVAAKRAEFNKAMEAPVAADALAGLGTSLTQLSTGITVEGQKIIDNLGLVVQEGKLKGEELGRFFAESFRKAKTEDEVIAITNALTKLQDEGKLTGVSLEEAGMAGTAAFNRLSEANIKAADSIAAVEREAQKVSDAFINGTIGEDEFAVKLQLIAQKTRELDTNQQFRGLNMGLSQLGINAQEVLTGISKSGESIPAAMDGIAASSNMTGDQIYRAFNGVLAKASTLDDLKNVDDGLVKLRDEGKLAGDELASASQRMSLSFRNLFERDLKAAKTREEFDQLIAKVKDLGARGVITGVQVSLSMQRITESMYGFREASLRASKDLAELSAAGAAVARAQVSSAQKTVAVTRAQTEVILARNRVEREGTDEAKDALRIKEKELEVVKAEKIAADAQLEVELSGYRLKAAEQTRINALKRLENADTPENEVKAKIASDLADNAMKEYQAKLDAKNIAEQGVATAQEQLSIEQNKLEIIKQQNALQHGSSGGLTSTQTNYSSSGSVGILSGGSSSLEITDYEKQRDRPAGTLTAASSATMFKILGEYLDADVQQALSQAGYGEGLVKEMQQRNRARKTFGTGVTGMTDWNRVFEGISSTSKEMEEFIKKAKEVEKAAQASAKAYDDIAKNASDAELGISGLIEAHHGLSDESGKIAEVYNTIKRNAASASKEVRDSAKSYVSSMGDIENQLLESEGRNEEASNRRMEQRRQEMELEHTLLVAKLQTAKAQAQAAGIDSTGIDQALSNVNAAFASGTEAAEKLHQKELRDIRTRKAESDSAAKSDARVGTENQINDTIREGGALLEDSNVVSLQGARERLAAEKSITDERKAQLDLAKGAGKAPKGSSSEVMRQYLNEQISGVSGGLVPTNSLLPSSAQEHASKVSGTNGYLKPVDVVQVDLNMNGQRMSAYVPQENKDDFMDRLVAARKVATR